MPPATRQPVTSLAPLVGSRCGPVRLGVVDHAEIVVAGLRSMLEPHGDRVRVVRVGSAGGEPADVVLCDGLPGLAWARERLLGARPDPRLAVFSWDLDPAVVRLAVDGGAAGYLSKALPALALLAAVERVHAGEVVTPTPEPGGSALGPHPTAAEDGPPDHGAWPGQVAGLSARESEIVALIARGLSNREIAERCFLSINSVKTYIRTAYRKMGVEKRPQAVLWALRHGFVSRTDDAVGDPTPPGPAGCEDPRPA